MHELLKDYTTEFYDEYLLLISIFYGEAEMKAFLFRAAVEQTWESDTVPDGAEIADIATKESKHGKIRFGKEAIKQCSAAVARTLLLRAENVPERKPDKFSESDVGFIDFFPQICDHDDDINRAQEGV
jgi:hypothetical protein